LRLHHSSERKDDEEANEAIKGKEKGKKKVQNVRIELDSQRSPHFKFCVCARVKINSSESQNNLEFNLAEKCSFFVIATNPTCTEIVQRLQTRKYG